MSTKEKLHYPMRCARCEHLNQCHKDTHGKCMVKGKSKFHCPCPEFVMKPEEAEELRLLRMTTVKNQHS